MKKRKATKATIVFRVLYLSLSVLLITVIAVILHKLWNVLRDYEEDQPETAIEALIKDINKDRSFLHKELEIAPNEFENEKDVKSYLERLVKGRLTYSKNSSESGRNLVVYDLKANNKKIAIVTVKVNKSSGASFAGGSEYTIDDIIFGEVPTSTYSVTAPDNVTVFCNGKELDKKYISKTGEVYKDTKNFLGYADDFPYDVTYTVEGFINEPEFTAKDIFGNELVLTNGRFTLQKIKSEELSQLALNFSKSYSKYIMNDEKLDAVANYLAPNTKIYDNLSGYFNKWCREHYGYDFLDIEIEDAMFYNENAASVRLTYDHVLYNVPLVENNEFHSLADYTIYMVNTENGWRVVEMVINAE